MRKVSFVWCSLILALTACSSSTPQTRYYTLSVQPGSGALGQSVKIGSYVLNVSVPDSINRSEIVLRAGNGGDDASLYGALTSPFLKLPGRAYDAVAGSSRTDGAPPDRSADDNKLEVLPNDQWTTPFPEMLKRTLSADLASRLGAGVINSAEGTASASEKLSIQILEFSAGRDGQVVLDASWTTIESGGGIFPHRTRHVAFSDGADINQIVAAMSHLIGSLADDIAQTILPEKTPRKASGREKGT